MKSFFPRQEERAKIGLLTVHKLMKNYLYEVQVANYPLSPPPAGSFITNSYPAFLNEIIHNGNAVSLIDGISPMALENFFEPANLEKKARYVFWTFDKWFLASLKTKITSLTAEQVDTCAQIITENCTPYDPKETLVTPFSKVAFCNRKIKSMRKHGGDYDKLFELDLQNRQAVQEYLQQRKAQLRNSQQATAGKIITRLDMEAAAHYRFIDLLKPVKGSPEATLRFMQEEVFNALVNERLRGSIRVRDIFSKIPPDGNGANPKGVNGTMMAFIDFFELHGYFEKSLGSHPLIFKDVLAAFLSFTGNHIGNIDTIVGKRETDDYYQSVMMKLHRKARSVLL